MDKLYYIPTDKKLISLTFDDGPSSRITPIILKILKLHDIKATFFVLLDNVDELPTLTQRIVAEGHRIGIHSSSHNSFKNLNKGDIYRRLKKCIRKLENLGVPTDLIRPPYGTMPLRAIEVFEELNLKPIGWSVMSNDWTKAHISKKIDGCTEQLMPGQIYVFHDGYKDRRHRGSTMDILDNFIPTALREGYAFVQPWELKPFENARPLVLSGNTLWECKVFFLRDHYVPTLYWDMNGLQEKVYDLKIVSENRPTFLRYTTPQLIAMKEWPSIVNEPLFWSPISEISIMSGENDIRIFPFPD